MDTKDVARLIVIACITGGVPLHFLDNFYLRKAFEVVQLNVAGRAPFVPPSASTAYAMRDLEAVRAADNTRKWAEQSGFGTLALDGRLMSEGRYKECMLNCAFVSRGQEHYMRSEDMSGVFKDTANVSEFVEASFAEGENRNHPHPAPSIHAKHVAAVCLDQPAVNVAALKLLREKWPNIADIPCQFHGLDGIIGHLVVKIGVLSCTRVMCKVETRFFNNQSRVRSEMRMIQKRRVQRKADATGRKVRMYNFIKPRKSRSYPILQTVKRCLQLNSNAAAFFKGEKAQELAGNHKHFAAMKRFCCTNRALSLRRIRVFYDLLGPVLRKMRLVDTTRTSSFPQTMLRLCDLKGKMTDAWLERRSDFDCIKPGCEDEYTENLRTITKECNTSFKKMVNHWVLAAHLVDQFHIELYAVEVAGHGPLGLEEDFSTDETMPASLDDPKVHRTFAFYARRAMYTIIEISMAKARRQLDQYLGQHGVFDKRKAVARGFWEDAKFDAMKDDARGRETPLWTLWARDEMNAPELQAIMQQLASIWPAQSASERANALVKHVTGDPTQNSFSMKARVHCCQIADHY
ncbi:unnamed protein product [Polarella glacialis]|uniref:Uncharacterized protein n=1 Tax=Polarella glacialis TaxID=89957 RepID=A0A813I5S5_POLGL|nr:unnamed protein product [Polarella glacialis]